jgi:hypothetical protein
MGDDAGDVGLQDRRRQVMDDVQARFRESSREHQVAWQQRQSEIPRRLYHYSTLCGLMGITSGNTLWASDARFLNDASELLYAASLISETVSEATAAIEGEELKPALSRIAEFANGFEYGARPFVACFCEEGDLLSQWRGYGDAASGVALGFDLHGSVAFGQLPPRTFLRRVVYDPKEQRRLVREAVDTWLATAESLISTGKGFAVDEVFPYPAIWALQEALAEYHLCFKNPVFKEEQEWRLIKLVDVREELRYQDDKRTEELLRATRERMLQLGLDMPGAPTVWRQANAEGINIQFRPSSMGLTPYVELPIIERAGVFTDRLPLWHVIQGPTTNPALSLESLRMYLESRGYGFHTVVEPSLIPLRR